MDAEREIAAKLAASLNLLEVQEAERNKLPHVMTEDEKADLYETPLDPIRAKAELMEFFNVPGWTRSSNEVQTRITAVMEWAQGEAKQYADFEQRAVTLIDVLRTINDRMRIMGITRQEDRLSRLWQFAKIRQQMGLLTERERALYG